MRALDVEFAKEVVEPGQLLQDVHPWRADSLLCQGQRHAFVAAVLLRTPWPDALDLDSEPKPPDRQLREVEQSIGAGKRHVVIGADGTRQAALTDQALEGGDGGLLAG